jgi:hypothetical protein
MGKIVIDADIEVWPLDDKKFKRENCFKIIGKNLKKIRILSAETPAHRKEWMDHITNTTLALKQGKVLRQLTSSKKIEHTSFSYNRFEKVIYKS